MKSEIVPEIIPARTSIDAEPSRLKWRRLLQSTYLRNVTAYSGTNIVSQLALCAQGFFIRHFLAPSLLGIWNIVTVFQNFLSTFDPGLTAAAFRELSIFNGAGREEEGTEVRSTALWSRLVYTSIIAAILVMVGFASHGEPVYRIATLTAAAAMLLSSVAELFIIFYQSSEHYIGLSRALLTYALTSALALPIFTYVFGIYGLFGALLAVNTLQIGLFIYWWPARALMITRAWRWPVLKRLVAFGVPFRLVDYPMSLMPMVDVLWITKQGTVAMLAIYVTAKTVLNLAIEIPARMGNVLISRLCNAGTNQLQRARVAKDLSTFLLVEYLLIFPPLIIVIEHAMEFLVAHFLPLYAQSIPVMRVLLLAIYFVPQTTIVRNVWILDKRLLKLGVSNIIGLVGMAGAMLVVTSGRHLDLISVAGATVCGFGVNYLYVMFTAGREVWGTRHAAQVAAHGIVSAGLVGIAGSSSFLAPVAHPHLAKPFGSAEVVQTVCLIGLMSYGSWRVWSQVSARQAGAY